MPQRVVLIRDLRELRARVFAMGRLAEQSTAQAMQALAERDASRAQRVVDVDIEIDRYRYELEEKSYELLATQQPAAGDLREIMVTTSMAGELERIGDHAKGIGRLAIRLKDERLPDNLAGLTAMGDEVANILRRSLQAYADSDQALAKAVIRQDDTIDRLYQTIFHALIEFMDAGEGSHTTATYLIWVAHNLERIADRATNIAERVLFLTTGKLGDQRENLEATD